MATVIAGLGGGARPGAATASVAAVPAGSDVLLVQPAPGIALDALARGLTRAGYELADGGAVAGVVRVAVPDRADPASLATAIAASGLARGVEADRPVAATIVPNDTDFARQADYLAAIRAPEAWDRVTGSGDTVIAIVDSGIDYGHPEFRNRIAINEQERFGDGRDDDTNGCVDDVGGCNFVSPPSADPRCGYTRPAPNGQAWDDAGHGTVVAGIAAAAGNDGTGVSGVAWDARILPVKVLDCSGVGRISTAAAGIRYAADRGAHVINISLGTTADSRVLREAVEYAQARDALIVASAGNEPGVVTYPAAYPGVIAVGASGAIDPLTGELDYRRATGFSGSGGAVALLAPGLLIAGPLPPALCDTAEWQCDDGPYTRVSGSSFAAALVAGAAALLHDARPRLGAPLLRSQLLRSLQPASAGGAGLLDLQAALEAPLYTIDVPGTARTNRAAPVGPGN